LPEPPEIPEHPFIPKPPVVPDVADAEMADALAILRHIIGLPNEVRVSIARHDFDGNGVIEFADALLVMRFLIGL
jgi:hypothetical protein